MEVTFTVEPHLFRTMTFDDVADQARRHVAEAVRHTYPDAHPSDAAFWIANDRDRMHVRVRFGSFWQTDTDCDGPDSYEVHSGFVTVTDSSDVDLRAAVLNLWESGAEAPGWVHGI